MFALRVFSAAVAMASLAEASSQFHLSLISASSKSLEYMLDWVVPSTANDSQVMFGLSADKMDQSLAGKFAGLVEETPGTSVGCWNALLPAVEPGVTVYYALKDDKGSPRNFTAPKGDFTWAVFGDLAASVQKGASGVSVHALVEELTKNHAYNGVLNIGDISYELTQTNGMHYMEELEVATSQVPMQLTIGNHEHQYGHGPYFTLQNYRRRFAALALGAGSISGSYSNEFYSFNAGYVHFAFINTEVYGDEAFMSPQEDGSWSADEKARREMAKAQAAWLAYDLSRVDRAETPFVIMCGHRPPFKTPKRLDAAGNKFAEEIVPLMSKYDVDLYFAGHEHIYMYFEASTFKDYKVPPIIISGSPGNNEYVRTKAEMKIEGFKEKIMVPKYGFGYLTATADALKWQWGSAGSDGGRNPKPTSWKLEDEQTFKKKNVESASTKEGSPVKDPATWKSLWASMNNASSGSLHSDDVIGTNGTRTMAPSDPISTKAANSTGGDAPKSRKTSSNAIVINPVATTITATMLAMFTLISSLVAVGNSDDSGGIPYSRQDLRIMAEFLPDFLHAHHSTKKDQDLLLAHWDKLFSQTQTPGHGTNGAAAPSPMVTLFDNFYKHLFDIAPEVKPLFRSSMQVQGKALVRIVGSIKNMLQSPDIVAVAAELAHRHVKYGIKLAYFNALGVALMRTLQSCSEELWTPETEAAWRKVYAHVALIVVVALGKEMTGATRKSSLILTFTSQRAHTERMAVTQKSNGAIVNPHGGNLPVDATCPVSGNKLSDMPQPNSHQGRRSSEASFMSRIYNKCTEWISPQPKYQIDQQLLEHHEQEQSSQSSPPKQQQTSPSQPQATAQQSPEQVSSPSSSPQQ
ncbi:TPA: hypothetical protein N0F65_012028 [Lagenidium giganteum]|uniref:Globin domain-containing protein n=1 Tax=Lagenidium giganteum TaxID=4803 RepID=A0AAV2YSD7_9STRA|nr:TPA: hypothetical protein N0F65_012028 [Lagenidium giganteum]